jgi:hypothetical protein
MPARKNSFLATVFIALIFTLLGGGVFFFWALPGYFRAKASTDWPTVDGRVDFSQVNSAREKKKTNYWAEVRYSYDVAGKSYQSDDIWASGGYRSTSKATHQAVVDRYPPQKAVKVYYDPQKPDSGILEPGVTFANYMLLGIGGVLFVVGLGFAAFVALKVFFFIAVATAG